MRQVLSADHAGRKKAVNAAVRRIVKGITAKIRAFEGKSSITDQPVKIRTLDSQWYALINSRSDDRRSFLILQGDGMNGV